MGTPAPPPQVSERPRHDPPPTHKHAQADPGPSNAAAGLSREPDARISRAGRARAASPPVSVDAPSPSASPESGQAARQSQAFLDLMAQYEDLARRYKSLASSKIRDAEDKCQERDRRVAELESATDRLAQHWKQARGVLYGVWWGDARHLVTGSGVGRERCCCFGCYAV